MTQITHGMDVEAIEALGRNLQNQQAAELNAVVNELSRLIAGSSVYWPDPTGDRFRSWWPDKRQRLLTVAGDLHGFGQSALNNANEQRQASSGGPGTVGSAGASSGSEVGWYGGTTFAAESESYALEGGGSLFVVAGSEGESEVVVTRMTDGTYRVTIASTAQLNAGIGLGKLFEAAGVELPADLDLGLGVSTENGWQLEFSAADEETARALSDVLRGRSSSLTNRFFGGVDRAEIAGQQLLADDRIALVSLTDINESAGVDAAAVIGPYGASGELSTHTETVYGVDGTVTHRTVSEGSVGGDGWNKDGVAETYVQEVVVDGDGQVVSAVVEKSVSTTADTRGGGEKLRDATFGYTPVLNVDNTEFAVETNVHRLEFTADQMPPEMLSAASAMDRSSLADMATTYAGSANETQLVYAGSSESSTRGLTAGIAGYGSTATYGDMDLVAGQYRVAGASDWAIVTDLTDEGLSPQTVTNPDGSESTVWTGTF